MITVRIWRDPDGRVARFTVSGHAYYDEPGRDIVCAGVSAVAIGAVNAVERLAGLKLRTEMREGFLDASVPPEGDGARRERAQLLLEGMLVALESIAESYGEYVRIEQSFVAAKAIKNTPKKGG
ncbi:MAG: ribosomal protein [Paenibacillaceae bacterium ZCTH02-B3]|nr:MAG: ribosomal protein [Paenibacillaceae bacterium ZCTH02-B3]